MKVKLFLYSILVIISIVVFGACATTTLKSVWNDSAYQGGPLKKVFVVGVFQKQTAESFFEDEFVRQLKARGVDAIPWYSVLPEDKTADKETVLAKIHELGVDSIIVTRMVEVKESSQYDTYPYLRDAEIAERFFDYYVLCCQNVVSLGYNILFETRIFAAKSDTLIWSAQSETSFEGTLENTVKTFIPAVMKDLQSKKLLP